MTYVGMVKNEIRDFQTLVLADSDEEARAKVHRKFVAWWGKDYPRDGISVRAFGDARRAV